MPHTRRKPTALAEHARKLNKPTIEKLLEAVRASLETYGTVAPPREALFALEMKLCPHCGDTKPVMRGFGLKTYKGVTRPQSWCHSCRNSMDSHPARQGPGGRRRS
jgi:hypothetical protein